MVQFFSLYVFGALLLSALANAEYVPFSPCPAKTTPERRILHILTCDTRSGMKEYVALRYWNLSSAIMREADAGRVVLRNMCSGIPWKGFITKPATHLAYLQQQLGLQEVDESSLYAILMDSDTMFNGITTVDQLWHQYDCALQHYETSLSRRPTASGVFPAPAATTPRTLLIGTETTCWVGQYCTQTNVSKWYAPSILPTSPTASPFINSGIIMGSMRQLADMLEYVQDNSANYFLHAPHKNNRYIFDDQFAYADYCILRNPSACALDYYQQLSASFSLTLHDVAPLTRHRVGWPFVCTAKEWAPSSDTQMDVPVNPDDTVTPVSQEASSGVPVAYNCPDMTTKLVRQGYFTFNQTSCSILRQWHQGIHFQEQLQALSPTPAIFHGNGAGKMHFIGRHGLGEKSFQCNLHRVRGQTPAEFYSEEGYARWGDPVGHPLDAADVHKLKQNAKNSVPA